MCRPGGQPDHAGPARDVAGGGRPRAERPAESSRCWSRPKGSTPARSSSSSAAPRPPRPAPHVDLEAHRGRAGPLADGLRQAGDLSRPPPFATTPTARRPGKRAAAVAFSPARTSTGDDRGRLARCLPPRATRPPMCTAAVRALGRVDRRRSRRCSWPVGRPPPQVRSGVLDVLLARERGPGTCEGGRSEADRRRELDVPRRQRLLSATRRGVKTLAASCSRRLRREHRRPHESVEAYKPAWRRGATPDAGGKGVPPAQRRRVIAWGDRPGGRAEPGGGARLPPDALLTRSSTRTARPSRGTSPSPPRANDGETTRAWSRRRRRRPVTLKSWTARSG